MAHELLKLTCRISGSLVVEISVYRCLYSAKRCCFQRKKEVGWEAEKKKTMEDWRRQIAQFPLSAFEEERGTF